VLTLKAAPARKKSALRIGLGLALLAAATLTALPLWAGDALLTRDGLDYLLGQRLSPRQLQVESLLARAAAAETRLRALQDQLLRRIYLWPGDTRVEYRSPDGQLTATAALDVPPLIQAGRTLVPLRFVGEALGAAVSWQGETQQVAYLTDRLQIILTIGQNTALLNGQAVTMDASPRILNGRTLVPVRFVSQWLGAAVNWDDQAGRVEIRYYDGPPLLNPAASPTDDALG
jgi:hypothetical protein